MRGGAFQAMAHPALAVVSACVPLLDCLGHHRSACASTGFGVLARALEWTWLSSALTLHWTPIGIGWTRPPSFLALSSPPLHQRPLGVSHVSPRAQTCTFEGPGLQKHHQNSTRRPPEREQERKWERDKEKKSEILGPSPLEPPPLGP